MDAFPVSRPSLRCQLAFLCSIAACGGDDGSAVQDAPTDSPDAPPSSCQPLGATGAFYRRTPNPRVVAGDHTFSDNKVDTRLSNPDLVWDAGASTWHLYYDSPHGDFGAATGSLIRHATSPDLVTWTFGNTPALEPSGSGWDQAGVFEPSVTINPAAPASQRFTMAYSAAGAIGVAISADGATFTRVGTDGQVLTRSDVYPGSTAGSLGDPEIVAANGTYHLWFASTAMTNATATAHGIAHATSSDAITWTPGEAPVHSLLKSAADANSGYDAASAVYDDVHCRWEMWLSDPAGTSGQTVQLDNASGVFHATSSNAMTWTADFQNHDVAWDGTKDGEAHGMMAGADVALKATARYMLYPAFDDANVPSGSTLPTSSGTVTSVMTLNLAARDAPP